MRLTDSSDEEFELLFVFGSYEVILAQVFITTAPVMALVEGEHFVDGDFGSLLVGDHGARFGRHLLDVGGFLELAVPFIAGAFTRVLAAVKAIAEGLAFGFVKVRFDVLVVDLVLLDVL